MFDREALLAALVSLLLAVYVLAITGGIAFAQEPDGILIDDLDSSAFPSVVVTITGPSSLAGSELTEADVTVRENGEVRAASITAIPSDDLEVILLIDTSGSMSGAPITQAREAASQFIDQMPPTTRIAVIGFGPEQVLASEFTTDTQISRDAVAALPVFGETALYDAVLFAIAEFGPSQGAQRRLVIVSDGGDTASGAPIDLPITQLRSSGVQVQVISLLTPESDSPALASLAAAGNGRVVEATDPASLTETFQSIASALVGQYEVAFEAEQGGRTEIEIAVSVGLVDSFATTSVVLPQIETPVPTAAPTPVPAESLAQPAATATPALAPVTTLVEDSTASWLYPVGLVSMFAALAGLFWLILRPSRRASALSTWAPTAVDSGRSLSGWLRGTPGLLTEVIGGALSRKGRERRLELALARAGIELRATEMVLIGAVAVAIAVLIGLLAFGLIGGAALGVATFVAIRAGLGWMGRRRTAAFAAQLHGALTMMAGSLRSGYSLSQSVDAVARETESPISDEFNRALVEVQLGRDLTEAFEGIADRVDSADFHWVVEAIEISRTVGGNLGEVLDNVAKTIRDRDRVARQVRTLSAEGRLSAWILSFLPFIMAAYLALVNPDYLSYLTDTGAGRVVMSITGVIVVVGIVWMRKIVKPEF
jgi:tight adherence protein B